MQQNHDTDMDADTSENTTRWFIQHLVQSSALLAHCEGNPLQPMDYPQKGSVMWKAFPCQNFIMWDEEPETSQKNTREATCYWSMTFTPTLWFSLQRLVLDNWISGLCIVGMGFCCCRRNVSSTVISNTIHIKLLWFTPGIKTPSCHCYNTVNIIK